jgi:SHS2 domain-containing protein
MDARDASLPRRRQVAAVTASARTPRSPAPESARAGHAARPHTADVIVEAWAPSRTGCLEELVRGVVQTFADVSGVATTRELPVEIDTPLDEDVVVGLIADVIYILDADGLVALDVSLEENEQDGSIKGTFCVAPVEQVTAVGAPPKGVSRSDLVFGRDDSTWRARIVVDV